MGEADLAYYRRRYAQEVRMAAAAGTAAAAAAHHALAVSYAETLRRWEHRRRRETPAPAVSALRRAVG